VNLLAESRIGHILNLLTGSEPGGYTGDRGKTYREVAGLEAFRRPMAKCSLRCSQFEPFRLPLVDIKSEMLISIERLSAVESFEWE